MKLTLLTKKIALFSSLFLIAAGLTCWSIIISIPKKHAAIAIDNTLPDAFMENVIAIVFNKSGKPSLKIETPKMIHYQKNDVMHFSQPQVTLFRDSPNPWYINSLTAETRQGANEIFFSNNVVIHHAADSDNPNTTLTTETLTVFPKQQIASTQDAVVIMQPDTVVHATGMQADLNDGTIKLMSKAKGEYVPTS